MRPKSFVPAVSLLALAACGGDSTGPSRLSPEEVSGTYNICQLTFTPSDGTPPAVDIRANAIEDGSGVLQLVSQAQGAQLRYTPPGGNVLPVQINATYSLGSDNVMLRFGTDGNQPAKLRALLLPSEGQLPLTFSQTGGKTLVGTSAYQVNKADYEQVAGQTYSNVTSTFRGTLSANFSTSACQ